MNKEGEKTNSQIFEMILDVDPLEGAKAQAVPSQMEDWHTGHEEGQLAVDVLETKTDIVVISSIAGVETSSIELHIHNDLLTIRGTRPPPLDNSKIVNYFHEECFWGVFSRTIVLPVEVRVDSAQAEYKNGILIIRIPKQRGESRIPVIIVEE